MVPAAGAPALIVVVTVPVVAVAQVELLLLLGGLECRRVIVYFDSYLVLFLGQGYFHVPGFSFRVAERPSFTTT